MEIKYWFLLVLSVIVASTSQILLKKSALKKHANPLREYLNAYVIIGYGLMVVSTLLVILAYRGLDYKNGPIIESLGYPLIMLLSAFFLSEKITPRKILGNLLIIAGIAIFYL